MLLLTVGLGKKAVTPVRTTPNGPGCHRGDLLAHGPAAKELLDPGARCQALCRELVNGFSTFLLVLFYIFFNCQAT